MPEPPKFSGMSLYLGTPSLMSRSAKKDTIGMFEFFDCGLGVCSTPRGHTIHVHRRDESSGSAIHEAAAQVDGLHGTGVVVHHGREALRTTLSDAEPGLLRSGREVVIIRWVPVSVGDSTAHELAGDLDFVGSVQENGLSNAAIPRSASVAMANGGKHRIALRLDLRSESQNERLRQGRAHGNAHGNAHGVGGALVGYLGHSP
eukprot:3561202-Prymnesium_polylepis.2